MKPNIPPVLIIFGLVCFALVQNTQAVSPPPDGGYPGANTAEGQNALLSLSSGIYNTAVGFSSLKSNTTGNLNTAIGGNALSLNTTGVNNTANGVNALYSNTTGFQNTAVGVYSLFSNTTASYNTANGFQALYSNTTGGANTAVGFSAGFSGGGGGNTAIGVDALFSTTGDDNTAVGVGALFSPHNGNNNTAIGVAALYNAYIGDDNIALGDGAGYNLRTGNNNIYIYDPGMEKESNTIRIGTVETQTATFIAGITGTAVTGAAVVVDANGQLGVAPSSERFKDEIKPMNAASEAILALKPVTFRYKKEIDAEHTLRFGLVAEEVAKVNPDLVVRDKNGEIYTARYDQVNAMLLNEFLKEHRTVQELKSTVAKQEAIIAKQQKGFKSKIAAQQKQIEALSDGLQKVSAQLEASKPAPQVVNNP